MAGPMRGVEAFFDGERVVGAEEGKGIGGGHALRVFGEWLRGDADGLHFVAGFFEGGFCGAEEFQNFLDLGVVVGAIEADEGCDGADFGFLCDSLS